MQKNELKKNSEVLRKCAFCGGDNISMGAFSISADCYIMCETCGASIEKEVAWNGMTQEEHDEECRKVLIEAWNTRTPSEELVARLEEMICMFDENNWQTRYERYCKPKKEQCKGMNCFACVIGEAIEIVKEGMG